MRINSKIAYLSFFGVALVALSACESKEQVQGEPQEAPEISFAKKSLTEFLIVEAQGNEKALEYIYESKYPKPDSESANVAVFKERLKAFGAADNLMSEVTKKIGKDPKNNIFYTSYQSGLSSDRDLTQGFVSSLIVEIERPSVGEWLTARFYESEVKGGVKVKGDLHSLWKLKFAESPAQSSDANENQALMVLSESPSHSVAERGEQRIRVMVRNYREHVKICREALTQVPAINTFEDSKAFRDDLKKKFVDVFMSGIFVK